MARKFPQIDLSRLGDDKAQAIAGYGESVSAYRYIVLSEKSRDPKLKESFEEMAALERVQRLQIQQLLERVAPQASFYLSPEDKAVICVGPRLVDARDDTHFDEAMRLVIASEKRACSFYGRYSEFAKDSEVREVCRKLAVDGLARVHRLRALFQQAGRQITEACPVQQLNR